MTRELHCLQYGEQEIRYEIVRRPRKTLEIAVEPDASVVIAAPVAADANATPIQAISAAEFSVALTMSYWKFTKTVQS